MSTELTPIETSLVKPAGSPKDLSEAIYLYKAIQEELDRAMPDCIQKIAGKAFRKKNYWRAVKTAFNLKVECLKEERLKLTDEDWGFLVIYRAIAPNGAYSDGDGSCSYNEKSTGNMRPTLHNIRSQAHTRAFNRAVSNLVGFGEVSAEEVIEEIEAHKQEEKKQEPPKQEFPKKSKVERILNLYKMCGVTKKENILTEVSEAIKRDVKSLIDDLTDEEVDYLISKLETGLNIKTEKNVF